MELVHKRMSPLKIVCLSGNSINENGFRINLQAHNDTLTTVTTLQNASRTLITTKTSNVTRINQLCAETRLETDELVHGNRTSG